MNNNVAAKTQIFQVWHERFDCFPEPRSFSKESECLQRGCCWSGPTGLGNPNTPFCFYPTNFPSYVVKNKSDNVYRIEKAKATFRPNEILKLEARIIPDGKKRLRVQIVDPNNQRWQVPSVVLSSNNNNNNNEKDYDFDVTVSENPFSIQIYRKSTGKKM